MSKTLSLSRQALERGRKESFTLMCEPELERYDSSQILTSVAAGAAGKQFLSLSQWCEV